MNIDRLGRILILGLLPMSLYLSGCTTVITEGAQKLWEDRSTEDQATDIKIGSSILKRLSDRDTGLLLDVSTDVWEQRVLLTGVLDKASEKAVVEKLVRSDGRIKRFYSNVRIVSKADKDKRRAQAKSKDSAQKSGGAGQTVNDFWIETKIKAQLLTMKGVTSVNYRWRSVFNDAFIIGRAGSAAEKRKVLKTVRETEGVKSVRDYIEIKPVKK
jgi:hyperosmotically inducible protein